MGFLGSDRRAPLAGGPLPAKMPVEMEAGQWFAGSEHRNGSRDPAELVALEGGLLEDRRGIGDGRDRDPRVGAAVQAAEEM
jgi:hypothetical protein